MGGWLDVTGYEFELGDLLFGEPELMPEPVPYLLPAAQARLSAIVPRPGSSLIYVYDFRDKWEHEIVVEALTAAEPRKKYPRCLDGARWGPPEHVGGVAGYLNFLRLLHSDKDEEREYAQVILERNFDPERFKVETINTRLRKLDRIPASRWYRDWLSLSAS
jgi:hypothetical protein